MNKAQQDFLEQLALRIPRLFEAIAQGNIKSEYIVGIRRIGTRNVRLKLVAEVVDPGANPLATHGQVRAVAKQDQTVTGEHTESASNESVTGSRPGPGTGTGTGCAEGMAGIPAPASQRRRPRRR